MKAIILVGGFGTRLRPLTTNFPKSVVPFAGRPMVEWQIEALVNFGVKEIILTIFYKKDVLHAFVEEMEQKYKVKIHMSVENEPMNTGGPIKLAEKFLAITDPNVALSPKSLQNTFFVLNSDIICDYPFKEMMDFHLGHDGNITILSHPVEEPSRYGVIVVEPKSTKVKEFVEKPKEFVGNLINAGIYIFDHSTLAQMKQGAFSLERELFPQFAASGKIQVFELKGFWKDIGIPADFLSCSQIYLNFFHSKGRNAFDDYKLVEGGKGIVGINLIHKDVKIEESALIGPYAVLHKGVHVGKHSRISRSIVMDNTTVGDYVQIFNSILMFDIKVANYVRIDKHSVIAEKVAIEEEALVAGEKIEPGLVVHAVKE